MGDMRDDFQVYANKNSEYFWTFCESCGSSSPYAESEQDAIKKHNEIYKKINHIIDEKEFYDLSDNRILRKFYAGMAMQGLCANSYLSESWDKERIPGEQVEKRISEIAVSQANSLIAALEEKEVKA